MNPAGAFASTHQPDLAARLARVRRIARLMDSSIGLPGTRFRFGLDGLLGLAPVAGDAAGADRGALSRIRRAAGQYRRRLRAPDAAAGDPGTLLAAAFPDRIAQRRGEPGSFRLSGGGGAKLPRTDPLANAALLAVLAARAAP